MSPRRKIDSTLYLALLGFFIEKPNYGYELYKHISNETSFFKIWYLKQSQFYGFLERLFQEGFLSQKMIEGDQYPDRKLFTITPEGIHQLENWITTPVKRGREMRQEFIAKLFIAKNLYQGKIAALVDNQLALCNQWLTEQDQYLSNETDQFQILLIDYRKKQIKAMMDWLNQVNF
ncbi:MAG: PadR family transcriptional regulator [Anaerolineaceae bacterium]|jgi:DNA-binding PadR family transcriptional regulator|nr:PadR family transcriptional regulator [Anaerolineaceae bacterium]